MLKPSISNQNVDPEIHVNDKYQDRFCGLSPNRWPAHTNSTTIIAMRFLFFYLALAFTFASASIFTIVRGAPLEQLTKVGARGDLKPDSTSSDVVRNIFRRSSEMRNKKRSAKNFGTGFKARSGSQVSIYDKRL